MAYAGARFTKSLLHAMKGGEQIVECAYVESKVADTEFFASPVLLGVSYPIHPGENIELTLINM